AGPAGPGQCVAGDDGAEALDEHACEAGLHRRQRHPAPAVAQDAVVVDLGDGAVAGPGAAAEGLDPDAQVEVVGGEADPVLELVDRDGGCALLHEQQPRLAGTTKLLSPVLFGRPLDERHLHGAKRTNRGLLDCFGRMNRSPPSATAGRAVRGGPAASGRVGPARRPGGPYAAPTWHVRSTST